MGQELAAGTWPLSAAGKVTQTDGAMGQTAHMGPRHLGSRLQDLCLETPYPYTLTTLCPLWSENGHTHCTS